MTVGAVSAGEAHQAQQLRSIGLFVGSLSHELASVKEGTPPKALMRELLAKGLRAALEMCDPEEKRRFLEALGTHIHKFPLQEQQALAQIFPVAISSEYSSLEKFTAIDDADEEMRGPTMTMNAGLPQQQQPKLPEQHLPQSLQQPSTLAVGGGTGCFPPTPGLPFPQTTAAAGGAGSAPAIAPVATAGAAPCSIVANQDAGEGGGLNPTRTFSSMGLGQLPLPPPPPIGVETKAGFPGSGRFFVAPGPLPPQWNPGPAPALATAPGAVGKVTAPAPPPLQPSTKAAALTATAPLTIGAPAVVGSTMPLLSMSGAPIVPLFQTQPPPGVPAMAPMLGPAASPSPSPSLAPSPLPSPPCPSPGFSAGVATSDGCPKPIRWGADDDEL